MRKQKTTTGFTLVELLVVVGIIALLVAILIPALKMARQAARTALCLSNMRNVANATSNYEAQNNGGLLPDWQAILPDRQGGMGLLDPKLIVCPAEADYIDNMTDSGTGSPVASQSISYSWNPWIGDLISVLSDPPPGVFHSTPAYFHRSSVRDGAEVALMADSIGLTTNGAGLSFVGNGGLRDPFGAGKNYAPAKPPAIPLLVEPSFHGRHGGRGVVLWLDGHASTELAVLPPPNSTPVNLANAPHPASNFIKYHIGYLVRSQADLSSMNGLYYFVSKKDAISKNDINAYVKFDPNGSTPGYKVNPLAW